MLHPREREAEKDAEDRKRELDEISELKSQIFSDPKLADPATEFQRRLQEREQQFLPDSARLPAGTVRVSKAALKQQAAAAAAANQPSPITLDGSPSPGQGAPSPMEDYGADDGPPEQPSPEPEPQPAPAVALLKPKVDPPKRKKLPVADIFNMEDDDEDKPKKKLKPLPPPTKVDEKKEKSADDKRKHIKSLIEKIPTEKSALFAYSVDWDLVDNQLMEKRIRPWVHKKIAEYIGEPEPTLTDFICSKVLAGSEPKAILEDVQMVLDEEAEVFVVKMWRLLIYEIENKKQKGVGTVAAK
jgi:RNA-binding protein 25